MLQQPRLSTLLLFPLSVFGIPAFRKDVRRGTTCLATATSLCIEYTTCSQSYGGCYNLCSPSAFTPPSCPPASTTYPPSQVVTVVHVTSNASYVSSFTARFTPAATAQQTALTALATETSVAAVVGQAKVVQQPAATAATVVAAAQATVADTVDTATSAVAAVEDTVAAAGSGLICNSCADYMYWDCPDGVPRRYGGCWKGCKNPLLLFLPPTDCPPVDDSGEK
ncbi:hypothetical protein BT63DRAFT_474920 [Microthyrium microscopicum]|uniref:CBM1 domain-containing protein n=1 Tax=Microthyrium microscopicum TaxID=703497 RepID=A0A6A6UUY1_9PEZI|nr:hypothetical protein BT63DRAFT_474920 [Microthyrium microscopicum]